MKWAGLLLLLLFVVLLQPLFSDLPSPEGMTETEIITELSENLNLREKALNERELNLDSKENSLNQREIFLNQTETFLNSRETYLKQREKSWIEINNYWKSYAAEMREKAKSEFWKGFLLGSGTGFFIGETSGIYFGLKLQL